MRKRLSDRGPPTVREQIRTRIDIGRSNWSVAGREGGGMVEDSRWSTRFSSLFFFAYFQDSLRECYDGFLHISRCLPMYR